jgi:hypothetical protein
MRSDAHREALICLIPPAISITSHGAADLRSHFASINKACACAFRSPRRSLWDHSQTKKARTAFANT